jgi:IS30 family transposase
MRPELGMNKHLQCHSQHLDQNFPIVLSINRKTGHNRISNTARRIQQAFSLNHFEADTVEFFSKDQVINALR